jgi:aspartyl-tRNA(Asn)/glutamyl-tRNA(Gln) amidotransferase subunit B
MSAGWEIVVGIETHAQLRTQSKIFSGASTAFGAPPNSQASAVDIALPGVLPVLNRAAVEHAIRFGLAIGGKINTRSIFARKNYFYPDLPKGYQISQYEQPIVQGGSLKILVGDQEKIVRMTRAHLEEDAGKSLHEGRDSTGIDLNRAGTPLLEIVSEPDLRGAQEAVAYARTLHSLVMWIGVCDGNMQEGSFRCDANVSVRKAGAAKLGTRCELKNLNSFRFMEQAIEFEAKRQIEILEDGGKIVQETRLYDPDRDETRSMRTKEDAQDYRYFPDPDLLPVVIADDMVERIREAMPDLPSAVQQRWMAKYGFSQEVAALLTSIGDKARFIDEAARTVNSFASLKEEDQAQVMRDIARTVVVDIAAHQNASGQEFSQVNVSPGDLAVLMLSAREQHISGKMAKEILVASLNGQGDIPELMAKRGKQISDAGEIEKLVDEAIAAGAKQVADYKAGKEKALQSLVGQVMKASGGKANPAQVNEILRRKLSG